MQKHLLITGLCCGLAFALSAPAALAQTADQTTDHQRIKALEARVAALEQRLDMPAATPQPASSGQPAPTAAPTPTPTPAASPQQPLPIATAAPASGDWSQLHRGMDPRQVTALLGAPDSKQVRPMSETWFYPDGRQLEFDSGNRLQGWSTP
jgi:hypothetical protein